jgi:hypothetical protein
MKIKYKPIKNCLICEGTGYFTSAMDFTIRCDCYKSTLAYKNRNKKQKIITFDKASLKFICEALKVSYSKNIIAFTKKGAITNFFDLLETIKLKEQK